MDFDVYAYVLGPRWYHWRNWGAGPLFRRDYLRYDEILPLCSVTLDEDTEELSLEAPALYRNNPLDGIPMTLRRLIEELAIKAESAAEYEFVVSAGWIEPPCEVKTMLDTQFAKAANEDAELEKCEAPLKMRFDEPIRGIRADLNMEDKKWRLRIYGRR